MSAADAPGTVLVLTSHDDYTSDLVIDVLLQRDAPVVRLNPGSGLIRMETEFSGGRWRGLVGDEHRAAHLEDVISVLWRWPDPPAGHPSITSQADRAWAAREDLMALYGVLRALPVRWFNHPHRATAANDKASQLAVAHAAGLRVPDTLITTNGAQALAWSAGRDVIYKASHAEGADEDAMVVAGRPNLEGLGEELLCAHTFQEVIEGPSIRLTRIGCEEIAVEISGTDRLDWRPVQAGLTYTPISVPPRISAGIDVYMRRFGLEYGAFDFIRRGEEWVFLECNPVGQFGFVQIKTGLPLTEAVVDRLLTPLPRFSGLNSLNLGEW